MSKIDKEKPKYYENFSYEPIDFMHRAKLNIYTAKVFKYLVRFPFKHEDKTIDLKKALYTIEKFKHKLYFVDISFGFKHELGEFFKANKNLITKEHASFINDFFNCVYENSVDEFIEKLKSKIKEYEK